MKKLLLGCLVFCCLIMVSSCGAVKSIVPEAKSTVNAVTLNELNLKAGDYSVLETISAEATVTVTYSSDNTMIEVKDEDNTFSYKKIIGSTTVLKADGVIRAGYLTNDYGYVNLDNPEDIVRKVAIYRLINRSQQMGADGLIEPVISTNVDNIASNKHGRELTVVYKTTVFAKPIKLKVTGK